MKRNKKTKKIISFKKAVLIIFISIIICIAIAFIGAIIITHSISQVIENFKECENCTDCMGFTFFLITISISVSLAVIPLIINHNRLIKKQEKKNAWFIISVIVLYLLSAYFGLNVFARTVSEFNDLSIDHSGAIFDKPIIYLYPKEKTKVSVILKEKDRITVSYPKYVDRWEVLAQPNGELVELSTKKQLYSLYYEGINKLNFKIEEEGFVIKGEDTATFLEEKLETLGLNYKEKEEFIVYWLPKLESNKYNYIRFATNNEIDRNMPLEIKPKPDTTIRILMVYKGLDKPLKVKQQKLTKIERKGYVAVEWGGTKIFD